MTDGFTIKRWTRISPRYVIIHFPFFGKSRRERAALRINSFQPMEEGLQVTDGVNLNSGQKAIAFLSAKPNKESWISYV